MSETPRGCLHHRLLPPLHRRGDGVPGGGEDPARRHPRDGPEVPGLAETLEEETTVAIDGESDQIDFLRLVKPGRRCSLFRRSRADDRAASNARNAIGRQNRPRLLRVREAGKTASDPSCPLTRQKFTASRHYTDTAHPPICILAATG